VNGLARECAPRMGSGRSNGSDRLVAMGREPNTGGIGLDKASVELDSRGYIRVNERLETIASGVWAVGDGAGSPQFTHVGCDDFRVVRDNWNGKRITRDRLVPLLRIHGPAAWAGWVE